MKFYCGCITLLFSLGFWPYINSHTHTHTPCHNAINWLTVSIHVLSPSLFLSAPKRENLCVMNESASIAYKCSTKMNEITIAFSRFATTYTITAAPPSPLHFMFIAIVRASIKLYNAVLLLHDIFLLLLLHQSERERERKNSEAESETEWKEVQH